MAEYPNGVCAGRVPSTADTILTVSGDLLSRRTRAVAATCLLVAALAGCTDGGDPSGSTSPSGDGSAATRQVVEACEVLTKADAEAVLGEVEDLPAKGEGSETADLVVTSCHYLAAGGGGADGVGAGLVVRSALTEAGAEDNRSVFEDLPDGAQEVEGYGDRAFWSPEFGQFHVLADDTWFLLTHGPLNPRGATLEDAKRLADQIDDSF